MNVQPKPSRQPSLMPSAECTIDPYAAPQERLMEHERGAQPAGPRLFVTWPVEFEVDPWRP